MPDNAELHVSGLSSIDVLGLLEELPDEQVRIQRGEQRLESDFGILGVDDVVVIVITAATINAISVWLAKRRVKSTKRRQLRAELRPDGTAVITVDEEETSSESSPPDPATAEAITIRIKDLLSGLTNAVSPIRRSE